MQRQRKIESRLLERDRIFSVQAFDLSQHAGRVGLRRFDFMKLDVVAFRWLVDILQA